MSDNTGKHKKAPRIPRNKARAKHLKEEAERNNSAEFYSAGDDQSTLVASLTGLAYNVVMCLVIFVLGGLVV